MTPKKLSKIKQRLMEIHLNPHGIRYKELVGLAKQLERTKSPAGKHPTYVRDGDPELTPPLSIPAHPGDMRTGTVCNVVNMLLSDVDVWEIYLMEAKDGGGK